MSPVATIVIVVRGIARHVVAVVEMSALEVGVCCCTSVLYK